MEINVNEPLSEESPQSLSMSRRRACGLLAGTALAAALPARVKASDSKDEPLEFRPAYEEWAPGRILVTVEDKRLYLGEERIGGDVVETFNVVQFGIAFTLSEEGGRQLKELSSRHLQKPLAVIYAGEVLLAPKVVAVMERHGQISMNPEGIERLKRLLPMKQR